MRAAVSLGERHSDEIARLGAVNVNEEYDRLELCEL